MMQLLAFFLGLAIQGAVYYYLWRRLVLDTKLGATWHRRLTLVLIAMALSLPITILAGRYLSAAVGITLGWPVFLGLALTGLMMTTLGLIDLIRYSHRGLRLLARQVDEPVDAGRRLFVNRILAGSTAVGAVAVAGRGMYQALRPADIVDVPVALSRFPEAMNGFKIVQLTDIHIGNTIGRDFVEDLVGRANSAGGDLIALTGDLVDGSVKSLAEAAAPLADLKARHGVYFVTGNHEYYSGVDPWIAYLRSLGIRVLRNERVEIADKGHAFDLVGVDDHGAHKWDGHGADLAGAVAGRDPQRELVVLAHQPRQIYESAKHGAGLQLSGHTHGGQIWPWHYLVMAQQGGLLAGRYQQGNTQLYVSRGAGHWGPPVRVLAPAEITRVILRSKGCPQGHQMNATTSSPV